MVIAGMGLKLRGQEIPVARNAVEGMPEPRFAVAVTWRGVNQIDALVQCMPHEPSALCREWTNSPGTPTHQA